jgi:hypothetical protein
MRAELFVEENALARKMTSKAKRTGSAPKGPWFEIPSLESSGGWFIVTIGIISAGLFVWLAVRGLF